MKVFSRFWRYTAMVLVLLYGANVFCLGQLPVSKYEVRAVWLTTIGGLDWPHSYARSGESAEKQKIELCHILDKLKAANINTVLLQTRIRGTVIYPSLYEPWDGCLSGIPGLSPGYDALQFAIDECHKRGMELHAWIVTLPIGKWNKEGCRRLRSKYPAMMKKIGDEGFINPESKDAASYLSNICREVVEAYDVDGIHLDYIRYPENWPGKVNKIQGRRNITNIVRQISNVVKNVKPWVKMSCSPVGKYDDLTRFSSRGWNAKVKVCQDAQEWMREGLMDELFPMMYFRDNQFYPFAFDWKENDYGRIISIGLGAYCLSPKEKDWNRDVLVRQMNVLRGSGMGHAFFRSKFFTDNIKGIYDVTVNDIDNYPSLVPPMTWQSQLIPTTPALFDVKYCGDDIILSWSGAEATSDSPNLLYNVYASRNYPVDVKDARNLIAARVMPTTIIIKSAACSDLLNYAVTAMDRYGNESEPIFSRQECLDDVTYSTPVDILPTDGHSLIMPYCDNVLDAEFVLIETLQGSIVATSKVIDNNIDISGVSDGVYVLKSLGRKGVVHRIGHFMVKRNKRN